MFLKRLEIYGFKSFAERLEVAFAPGITAIVGPNGSGKSNVGDAVRWVLGEQSAKLLRGTQMADVIFGGTEKRKPLSYCEVNLIFDNEDKGLPIEYSEVVISRRLYRSGESEYSINKTNCRLKDVVELFQDTGIGKEGYSIIGQGKIDNILSTRSDERRAVFEEAAGIVKYKTRKNEAERKLEHTCSNLVRICDIISELEDRIEPLSQQADVAREYLSLRESLRDLEVNLYLCQSDMAAEKKAAQAETLKGIDEETNEKTAYLARLEQEQLQKEDRIGQLENSLTGLRGNILELTGRLEKGAGDQKVFEEKQTNLEAEQKRLGDELQANDDLRAMMDATAKGDVAAAEQKEKEIRDRSSLVEAMEGELSALDAALAKEGEELEQVKNQMVSTLNRLSDVKANLGRYETMRSNIEARGQLIQKQRETLASQQTNILEAVQAQKEAAQDFENQLEGLRQEEDALVKARQELQEGYAKQQSAMQETQSKLQNAKSRLHMLEEMRRDYEGYSHSVKRLLSQCDREPSLQKSVCGVVAQLVNVPRQYEKAVEAALGAAMQNIVTPTEEDAKILIEFLRSSNAGRATFLPISAIRGRTLSPQERNTLSVPGCVGIASELAQYDTKYKEIFENLLGRTVICQTMDAAIALARNNRHAFRVVTLEGDIINAGGSMTGGSVQSKLTSLLGREREIDETRTSITAFAKKQEEESATLQKMRLERTALEEQVKELGESRHRVEIFLARENEKLTALQADLNRYKEAQEQLSLEEEQLGDTAAEIERNINEINQMQGSMEQSNTSAQSDITQRQSTYQQRRMERERMSLQLTEYKVYLAGLIKELDSIHQNKERLEKQQSQLAEADERAKNRIALLEEQKAELIKQKTSDEQALQMLKETLQELHTQEKEQTQQRDTLSQGLREDQKKCRELEQELFSGQERRHKVEMAITKVDSDIALLEQRIWDEYELTYASALEFRREDFRMTGSQTEINKLRRSIADLGPVNVKAIDEFVETKERFDLLTGQRDDLQKAEADLRNIIEELAKKMEKQFREQFAVINKYFGQTFAELFGGGIAELRLEEGQSALDAGIEIVAQPPGKNLQVLSLLSGGEKALTAIAILFAMLKLKPTPFCILDEIEAALDEANVYNFATYLRNFSKRTQFVVITHRKPTMEEADSLYGVAMEEKGVSRMVSVRLS